MVKIDAHHHLWEFDAKAYGWIDETMSALRRDFLPADLQQEMSAAGIQGAIAVQARQTVQETRWLLELADENDFIEGVVGWVPLADPNVGGMLDEFAANPKLRGVRHVLQDELDPDHMLRDDFNRGIRQLAGRNLTYDILIFERHLPQTIRFVDQHPNQKFVVDHLAKPLVKKEAISPWREQLHELAKRQNVYCKISGLATEADHKHWREEQLRPYLDAALSAFGTKRAMFGSDWPVCLLAIRYEHWAGIVGEVVSRLSIAEQQRLWAGTVIEAYGLT
jgi:L-fuconolactonase